MVSMVENSMGRLCNGKRGTKKITLSMTELVQQTVLVLRINFLKHQKSTKSNALGRQKVVMPYINQLKCQCTYYWCFNKSRGKADIIGIQHLVKTNLLGCDVKSVLEIAEFCLSCPLVPPRGHYSQAQKVQGDFLPDSEALLFSAGWAV